MAGFVTANRWATGVETHKTSEGRILCTGVGCVGCFPDVLSTEASELGVCDVDLTGRILGLRPFLDEENSRGNFKVNAKKKKRGKRAKPRRKGQKEKIVKEKISFEGDLRDQETNRENSEVPQPLEEFINVARQTEPSGTGIVSGPVLSEIVNKGSKQGLLTSEEESKPDKEEIPSDDQRQNSANCDIVEVDDNVNKTHRNSQRLFDQPLPDSRFEKIHDKMYIISSKDIAQSSCDNFMCEDDIQKHADGIASKRKQLLSSRGEDAVCFFFALEYYNSQRILPHFRVMEIVEALSAVVDLKDIKCVQRNSRRWHIVLKSRKYNRLLRNCGLKLRGRVYHLVDDVDSYFDVVH